MITLPLSVMVITFAAFAVAWVILLVAIVQLVWIRKRLRMQLDLSAQLPRKETGYFLCQSRAPQILKLRDV